MNARTIAERLAHLERVLFARRRDHAIAGEGMRGCRKDSIADAVADIAKVRSVSWAEIELAQEIDDYRIAKDSGRRGSKQINNINHLMSDLARVGVHPLTVIKEIDG